MYYLQKDNNKISQQLTSQQNQWKPKHSEKYI